MLLLPRTQTVSTSCRTVAQRQWKTRLTPIVCKRHKSGPYGYTQAKALVYSSYGEPSDVLSLHTHSISPSLPSKSVLLKTLATPINPADINQIQGVYPSRPPFASLLGTSSPSAVGGNEGCFEVHSVGSGVRSVGKGDWVIMKNTGFGTWRTHALAEEDDIIKIQNKNGLTPIQVGTVSVNPCTAYRMLKDFEQLEPGDWFIQNGANSGVGRAAIQLGSAWGFRSINVIRDRPEDWATAGLKKELLELGATHVVTEAELMERGFFKDRVLEWTSYGREKVKLGLNCVGGKPTQALVKCLGQEGTLVTYGGMSKQPLGLPTSRLIFDDVRFRGFWVSSWAARQPGEKERTVEDILRMTRKGEFKDVPVQELRWTWQTAEAKLKDAVQGTLQGFRPGKGIFVYEET